MYVQDMNRYLSIIDKKIVHMFGKKLPELRITIFKEYDKSDT